MLMVILEDIQSKTLKFKTYDQEVSTRPLGCSPRKPRVIGLEFNLISKATLYHFGWVSGVGPDEKTTPRGQHASQGSTIIQNKTFCS